MNNEKAKIQLKDYTQDLFQSCMKTCILTNDKETCTTQCLGESGEDNKAKGKMLVK